MIRILCLLAVVSACSLDVGKFDDRRCQSDVECRPDEACRDSLCAQEQCTTPVDCGPGYQYECEVGGCVATACTSDAECDLGFSCMDGFCAMECTGADADVDGVCDTDDNCVSTPNRNQTDVDQDLRGDACDTCPNDAENDADSDTICGDLDNCKFATNTNQLDRDNDGQGNECDADDDADGQIDSLDPSPLNPDLCGDGDADTCDDCTIGTDDLGPLVDRTPSNDGPDADTDGSCNAGDPDDDNDGRTDTVDRCPLGEMGWVSSASTDVDSDGCRDSGEDVDDDNDGLEDGGDPMPRNPDICGDSDLDSCDDCAVGSDNFGPMIDRLPAADGPDPDTDGQCNTGDTDDDNDGVLDATDTLPFDPDVCGDSDADTCDDCAIGTDGFGPLPDVLPDTDGTDTDTDGQCNAGDGDDDNDGIADALDIGATNPRVCGDSDLDTCDDCAVGVDQFGPLADSLPDADGVDSDSDRRCDTGDPDDDNDGVADAMDVMPVDPTMCADVDLDSCDDCTVGNDRFGPAPDNLPAADGLDTDGDGGCNAGDVDDDNDGVADLTDPNATNPDICGDTDADTCDDCAVGTDDFGVLADNTPAADGTDTDTDGQCDTGDPDDDNDMRPDIADTCPIGALAWVSNATTDIDLDGCRDSDEDCNTCAATCGPSCANTDGDAYPDCLEQYCGSDPQVAGSACVPVSSEATMNAAIAAANASTTTRDFILITASYTVAGDPTNITGNNALQLRACAGTTITVNEGSAVDLNRTLFDVSGDGNVFDKVSVANVDDGNIIFLLSGAFNTVRNSTIASYERTGVLITGTDNTVLNNTIRGGTAGVATANAAAIMVSGNGADRNRVVANVLVQSAHDGIRVLDGDDLLIDHNTIAGNGGDALSFVPTAANGTTIAANLCIRNNILTGNTGAALRAPANATIAFNTACELSLAGGLYGNDQFGNGAVCAGTNCTACACLTPAPVGGQASFFELNLAPAFTTTSFGREDFFCVAEAMLIDSGDVVDGDLVTAGSQPHDLNGREPGNFVPTAPDIGGREEGAEGCY